MSRYEAVRRWAVPVPCRPWLHNGCTASPHCLGASEGRPSGCDGSTGLALCERDTSLSRAGPVCTSHKPSPEQGRETKEAANQSSVSLLQDPCGLRADHRTFQHHRAVSPVSGDTLPAALQTACGRALQPVGAVSAQRAPRCPWAEPAITAQGTSPVQPTGKAVYFSPSGGQAGSRGRTLWLSVLCAPLLMVSAGGSPGPKGPEVESSGTSFLVRTYRRKSPPTTLPVP